MGEDQRQALARLFTEDEGFRAAMAGATSVEDAVRVAGEYGVAATVEDFLPPEGAELSDAQLADTSGGWIPNYTSRASCPDAEIQWGWP